MAQKYHQCSGACCTEHHEYEVTVLNTDVDLAASSVGFMQENAPVNQDIELF